MKTHLKLGTRKSLLAWAQSSWVARVLTEHHQKLGTSLTVELVGIETQGDKILDKPLSQIEGKEFFTAELDRALQRRDVDFTVHSMKDLSLDRPQALKLAAVPPRELQHDIVIFHEGVIARLEKGEPIRIGTSSPRRLTLAPQFLEKALPRFSTAKPKLEFREIRGNVNTRLGRIHEPETSDRKLDGVILAFAGLERLAQDEKAAIELANLLNHSRLMILPLRENPTAPAQGALAIEARSSDTEVLQLLSVLHDPKTLFAVQEERNVLGEWGGGCHQKLGASFLSNSTGGNIYIRGQKSSGENISEIRGSVPGNIPENYFKVQTQSIFDFKAHAPSAKEETTLNQANVVFIAHARAYEFLAPNLKTTLQSTHDAASSKRIWVSGTQSWYKLAEQGLWVEGCTGCQGLRAMDHFTVKKLLNLKTPSFKDNQWCLLTHAESSPATSFQYFKISPTPTYSHQFKGVPQEIIEAKELYWSSGLAFNTVLENFKSQTDKELFLKKSHACGPGRTLLALEKHHIKPSYIIGQEY